MKQEIITSIQKVRDDYSHLFTRNVLHVLNGQALQDIIDFSSVMETTNYAPFNEAMCIHEVSENIFDRQFQELRAKGHGSTIREYENIVINPLKMLIEDSFDTIVLWFGEDMFCQMNLLTILAYLEQMEYQGDIVVCSFKEDEWNVNVRKSRLGLFAKIYRLVLMEHQPIQITGLPTLQQAIDLYIELLQEDNRVTRLITEHQQLPESELIKKLFERFPEIGYGDTQYMEIISRLKN